MSTLTAQQYLFLLQKKLSELDGPQFIELAEHYEQFLAQIIHLETCFRL